LGTTGSPFFLEAARGFAELEAERAEDGEAPEGGLLTAGP